MTWSSSFTSWTIPFTCISSNNSYDIVLDKSVGSVMATPPWMCPWRAPVRRKKRKMKMRRGRRLWSKRSTMWWGTWHSRRIQAAVILSWCTVWVCEYSPNSGRAWASPEYTRNWKQYIFIYGSYAMMVMSQIAPFSSSAYWRDMYM